MRPGPVNEIPRLLPDWKPSSPSLSPAFLPDLLRQHRAVIIHAWATWNGYDQVMDPTIQLFQSTFGDAAFFASCNVDQQNNWELLRTWSVLNIPALAIYVDGEFRCCLTGCRDVESLRSALSELLDSPGDD